MSTKAYFTNRVYKNTLDKMFVNATNHALFLFNKAKHFSLNTLVKEKRSGKSKRTKSLHLTIREKFQLDDYFANSALQEANAKQKSLTELNMLYISNKEEQIKSVKKKLKSEKTKLSKLKKMKSSFVNGKPSFPQKSREQKLGNYFVVQFKKKTDIYYHAYQFEHAYLDIQVNRTKTKIGFLTFKLHKFEEQLKRLKSVISSVVFGTKNLFKSQYTMDIYKSNHEKWTKKWNDSRYKTMVISGRKDAASGNFVFNYDFENHSLIYKTPSGVLVEVKEISFPYGQEKVEAAISIQKNCKNKKQCGKPIAWSIEDQGEYYIFKCIINEEKNEFINYSKADGIIGIDCNVDHFAISNVNNKGQLLSSWSLKFEILGKSSNQITKVIEAEAIEVVNAACRVNKPIALEKLDTTKSKVSSAYGNKKGNMMMSMFAYNKMISAIESRAEKMGVEVFEVNPAYTSQIGKMKFMKRCGISIHEAASFVIARRALGFKEILPPVLHALLPEKIIGMHHWAQWAYISKILKDVRVCAFYQSDLFDLDKFRSTNEFFAQGTLTNLEQKGLSKLKSGKTAS
ncbi:IS200/IS605 family accessory protein TnpB-related protein [Neobacillus sp. MM2021_6]|uniref:IS200/IS605 family accessory protein TnpB-related protein n=1 Tax=Bacillaceae TaxID=186817 RepID=UPI00140DEDB0|nr:MULTISPECIES: IS200/IS605 family accessory protein TnpB-related protein [Bacillaceae]MBO0962089.1 IS200/IS605 family accessory protein TnpB-related protein [Neobacillus sp. MM2021_6]NHC20056.1 IS200/IS605 family element transposase accessory protein TnpB [Bacillus sp. MM2020_4]